MTRDVDEMDGWLDPELAARFELDAGAGPAPRLGAQRAAEMVHRALDAASPALGSGASARAARPVWTVRTLVATGAGIALVGGAAALYERYAAPDAGPAHTAPMQSGAPAGLEATDTPAPASAPTDPSVPATSPGDDLLKHANRLRARADFGSAERLYTRVFVEHPGSLAAYVARVAAASIRLEHLGDARGARALLHEALREQPGGSLDLEIHSGLAKAARVLGDVDGERAALDTLVAKHGGSLAAERARERLDELGTAR